MRIIEKLSIAEVVIISLLSEGEKYGYALNEAIEYRGIREWTNIGFSSIYAVLNRLEKKKFISSRLNPSKQGPAQKLYKLTSQGKSILLEVIEFYLSEPEPPRSRIDIAAAYIGLLSKNNAIKCLESYVEKLRARMDHVKLVRKQQQPLPFGAEIIFEHGLVKGRAELWWVKRILRQLKEKRSEEHGNPIRD